MDEQTPDTTPEPTPDAPTAAVADAPAEQPIATGWKKVRFLAPNDIDLPVEHAGRWWHGNSQHVLPAECAAELAAQPGFVILGDAPEPYNAAPCADCGKTKTA